MLILLQVPVGVAHKNNIAHGAVVLLRQDPVNQLSKKFIRRSYFSL